MRRGSPIAAALGVALGAACSARAAPELARRPPQLLSQTGLYADTASGRIAADVLPYAPQYPLWSDGAGKRRWVRLPPGTAVDGSRPEGWVFPAGTRFWKEFSFGRRVETRFLEKQADGTWIFASYVWGEDGRDAALAPERGVPGVAALGAGASHDIPSRRDCKACHEARGAGAEAPLGFDALQLSPDRDPGAPHAEPPPPGAVDLAGLEARGLIRHLPRELRSHPPRIAARTPRERAALGYLRANCATCHTARGALAALDLSFEVDASAAVGAQPAHRTAVARRAVAGGGPSERIAAGAPGSSAVVLRMSSRNPAVRMPPLGTQLVDEEAVRLITAWIDEDLRSPAGEGRKTLDVKEEGIR